MTRARLSRLLAQLTSPTDFIPVNLGLVDLLDGDHFAALMLTRILYWSERTDDREGWIRKTYADWQDELRLGKEQVMRAAQILETVGIERKRARYKGAVCLHYRVNWERLDLAIAGYLDYRETRLSGNPIIRNPDNRETPLPIVGKPDNPPYTKTYMQNLHDSLSPARAKVSKVSENDSSHVAAFANEPALIDTEPDPPPSSAPPPTATPGGWLPQRSPLRQHWAVAAYLQAFQPLERPLTQAGAQLISNRARDQDVWNQTLTEWASAGWKTYNIPDLIKRYENNEREKQALTKREEQRHETPDRGSRSPSGQRSPKLNYGFPANATRADYEGMPVHAIPDRLLSPAEREEAAAWRAKAEQLDRERPERGGSGEVAGPPE